MGIVLNNQLSADLPLAGLSWAPDCTVCEPTDAYSQATSDHIMHPGLDPAPALVLSGIFVLSAFGAGSIYALRRCLDSFMNSDLLPVSEIAHRIEEVSKQRAAAWAKFYNQYYGSVPVFRADLESSARRIFRLLPLYQQWSFAFRDGAAGAIDIEHSHPDAEILLPPVSFLEQYVKVFHVARQDDIAVHEVKGLDQAAAIYEMENSRNEFNRYLRVFQDLYGRLSSNGREVFSTEMSADHPTLDADIREVHQRSHLIAHSYSRIIENLGELRRVGFRDRITALLLSIKATHMIFRAIGSDEFDQFINRAVRTWENLSKSERESWFLLDMMMGMKEVRELKKNPAPFAVTWCFMWAWPIFSQQLIGK